MLASLLEASRTTKRTISVIYDVIVLSFSFYLALSLRLGDLEAPIGYSEALSLITTVSLSILIFIRIGLYRAILRFMAQQALLSVVIGVLASAVILATSSFFYQSFIPRSVPIIYGFAALFFVGMPRLLVRNLVLVMKRDKPREHENVIIYGAGHSGFQLASAIHGTKYKVVGFVDDNARLHGTLFRGQTVYSPHHLSQLLAQRSVKHILLALGDAPRSQRASILSKLEDLEVSIKTIPAMDDVLSGRSKIEDIRDVEVEDLLGRDPVTPDLELMSLSITSKNVLVTGAGGSIGAELCRQIIRHAPKRIVLFELNEFNLYKIEAELNDMLQGLAAKVDIIGLIGSVQNREQLDQVLTTFEINTIYHAAAYKHVPIIEHNIIAGVKNNILGTYTCAQAAIDAGVDSFVMISTDKAVRPTNVMGATKRVAELVLQALAQEQKDTRFTMVRFGNVLGSSGSVVPLFRKQIQEGGPVTVTHPEIIRYFMTIKEASELVIQAGSMGTGGDVFVLDMGEPIKIIELAKKMIHLSGLTLKDEQNPLGDIRIDITGLRSGEKLYEELLIGDNVTGTNHPRIMRSLEDPIAWGEVNHLLAELKGACDNRDCDKIRALLLSAPTDFNTTDDVKDLVWNHKKPKLRVI